MLLNEQSLTAVDVSATVGARYKYLILSCAALIARCVAVAMSINTDLNFPRVKLLPEAEIVGLYILNER